MSDFYVTDNCTSDPCPFFKFSNRHPIPKSMTVSHFLKSTSNALTLTNKSAIDLRICKGYRFENILKSDSDLRSWRQWMPIWGGTPIWVHTLIWVYHIFISCLTCENIQVSADHIFWGSISYPTTWHFVKLVLWSYILWGSSSEITSRCRLLL